MIWAALLALLYIARFIFATYAFRFASFVPILLWRIFRLGNLLGDAEGVFQGSADEVARLVVHWLLTVVEGEAGVWIEVIEYGPELLLDVSFVACGELWLLRGQPDFFMFEIFHEISFLVYLFFVYNNLLCLGSTTYCL